MEEKEKSNKENNYKLKISLKLYNQKYSPSEEVEGVLIIQPNKEIKLSNILEETEFHFLFQETILYENFENTSKTFILDRKVLKHKNNKDIDNKKILKIPIKYKLPDIKTKNFHPSFIYFSESIKCIISHSLSVELPFISNKSSVNIFIRKIPIENKNKNKSDKIIFGDELIKKYFFFNVGKFNYYILTKKSISYKEKFPIEIYIDESEMEDIKISSVFMKIKKLIYFYNELNVFSNTIEENYDNKQFILNKNLKNKNRTIVESFQLPKTEFIPISLIDFQKINSMKTNLNFTPPVNNILFKCEYSLEISFIFNDKLIPDKIINIPIDYYDNEFYNKKDNNNILKEDINENKSNFSTKLNKIKKENNIKINNEKNQKNNNSINGFIQITNQDLKKMKVGNAKK